MERQRIAALLEKYWQAETTVEEERELAEYFRRPGVPPEWASYREIFSFFEQEAQVQPSESLEERIMQRISSRPQQRTAWWAAAAAILLLLSVEPLFRNRPAPEKASAEQRVVAMADTYDDPEQALAAVRKALFTVSKKMNEGLQPIK